jgi:two-component system LytT family response regulator
MTKCLVLEDEPLAQRVLATYIRQTPGLHLVGACSSVSEALRLLSRGGIDLLFLDLHLPGGLQGHELMPLLKHPPALICTTAHPEYGAASYEWGAVDYLLKPIPYARFAQGIARYQQRQLAAAPPAVAHTYFKVNGQLLKVPHAELLYAQSVNDYLVLRTTTGAHLTHMTIKYLEDLLPAPPFRRVHRSFLLNTDHLTALTKQEARVGSYQIPLGEQYKYSLGPLWDSAS